jgi:hypothetical protein
MRSATFETGLTLICTGCNINKIYLSVIAFIVFTLHEIKQRKFFGGHPGIFYSSQLPVVVHLQCVIWMRSRHFELAYF